MKNTEKQKSPIQNLYSVQDTVAGRFFPPFLAPNDETAVRSFRHMVNMSDSPIAHNPFDYRLFRLGDFDENDGQIDVLVSPDLIINGSDLAQKQPNLD